MFSLYSPYSSFRTFFQLLWRAYCHFRPTKEERWRRSSSRLVSKMALIVLPSSVFSSSSSSSTGYVSRPSMGVKKRRNLRKSISTLFFVVLGDGPCSVLRSVFCSLSFFFSFFFSFSFVLFCSRSRSLCRSRSRPLSCSLSCSFSCSLSRSLSCSVSCSLLVLFCLSWSFLFCVSFSPVSSCVRVYRFPLLPAGRALFFFSLFLCLAFLMLALIFFPPVPSPFPFFFFFPVLRLAFLGGSSHVWVIIHWVSLLILVVFLRIAFLLCNCWYRFAFCVLFS